MVGKLLALIIALAVPRVSITAPPAEAEQLEAAVRLTAPYGVEIVESEAEIEVSRDPDGVTVRVLEDGKELSARHVPVEGPLEGVALQEVAEIVAEAAAAHAGPDVQRPTQPAALPPPEEPAVVEPVEVLPEELADITAVEPEVSEPPPPPRDPSFTNARGRSGFITPGIGLGIWGPGAALSLATGLSLGLLGDLSRGKDRVRNSRVHASIAFRFGSQSVFARRQNLHMLNLWARGRIGGVTLKNFTYAAFAVGYSFFVLAPKCVEDQCGSVDGIVTGSLGLGSQWLVTRTQAVGFEADIIAFDRFRSVVISALVVYALHFGFRA